MAKKTQDFVCQGCGATYTRWQGKCDACGEWNTIAEEGTATERILSAGPGRPPRKGKPFALQPLAGEQREAPRIASGNGEFDHL